MFFESRPVRLTSLDELDCSFNEIEALPPSIGQCAAMRTFAADHNFLSRLPPEASATSVVPSLVSALPQSKHLLLRFFFTTDGQLEERHRAVPAFQQAGVAAGGDGRHAEAEGHQSEQQQVSGAPNTQAASPS